MGEDNAPDKQVAIRDDQGKFVPGVSGNPNGRPPKGHSITDTIRAMMDEKPEIKRALGQKVLQMALEGDGAALRLIWSYIDGMPKQTTELTGDPDNPLVIIKDGNQIN